MQPTFSCLCWPYHQSRWKESGVNSPGKDTLSDTSHFYSLKVESELTKAEVKNHIYMDWVWVKLQRLCSVTNFWVYLIFLHRQDIWFQRHKYPCSWIWAWLTVWVDTDLKRTLRNIFLCLYWGFYMPLFWEILYRHFDSSALCWRTGWLEVLLSQNKLNFHRAVKQKSGTAWCMSKRKEWQTRHCEGQSCTKTRGVVTSWSQAVLSSVCCSHPTNINQIY